MILILTMLFFYDLNRVKEDKDMPVVNLAGDISPIGGSGDSDLAGRSGDYRRQCPDCEGKGNHINPGSCGFGTIVEECETCNGTGEI